MTLKGIERYNRPIFLFILVVATVSMVAIGIQVHRQNNQIKTVALDTHSALCTFKGDLKRRVTDTEQFLKEHPEGIPGVPTATIRRSLDGQRATIRSLASLNCL